MLWENMSDEQRNNLFYYEKYLEISSPSDIEKKNLLRISKYCLKNDLCVTELPNPVVFDIEYQEMATKLRPEEFRKKYHDYLFVDGNGETFDAFAFVEKNNVNIIKEAEVHIELLDEYEKYYKLFLIVKYKGEETRGNLNTMESYKNTLHRTFTVSDERKSSVENSVLGKTLKDEQRKADSVILRSPNIISYYNSYTERNNLYKKDNIDNKSFKEKCVYLAEESNLPAHMGELLLSEIKLGDKTCPEIVNRAVKIGLLGNEFWIDN